VRSRAPGLHKNYMIKKSKRTAPSMPTSVVTGAAGFLGSHLTDLLLSRGHRVIGIDNFVTGSVDNISHLGGNRRFRFIEQDVTEFIFLDAAVDYVWHFASPASPIDYLELPIQTLKVGSLGTHKALGLAKIKGARFLLASTSEIYGDPLVHPQAEDYWGNVNQSARVAATTRPSALPRRWPWPTTRSTESRPALSGSSTRMARECGCTMVAWSRRSSARR
jgi:hypothetical protein